MKREVSNGDAFVNRLLQAQPPSMPTPPAARTRLGRLRPHRSTGAGARALIASALWLLSVGVAAAAGLPDWIQTKSQARLIVVTLAAGAGDDNGGLNYNGLHDGSHRIVVPLGWTVIIRMRNADSRVAHSALITRVYQQKEMPDRLSSADAVFPGAATPVPFTGTAAGGYGEFAFSADRAGHYLIACGVFTHLQAGMWLRLDVAEDAAEPDYRSD